MTDAEFWRLTPRQFSALSERHRAAQHRADFRSAQVVAMIANTVRDASKHSEPFLPTDFMPDPPPEHVPTPEEELEKERNLVYRMTGKWIEKPSTFSDRKL